MGDGKIHDGPKKDADLGLGGGSKTKMPNFTWGRNVVCENFAAVTF